MVARSLLTACLVLVLNFPAALWAANHLSVERRTLRHGEMLMITVSLEDEFAELDDVRVPVYNLTITDPPSVGSEFSWINGRVVRRKVFRFRARPNAPGPATVGPVTLVAGGQRDTLNPIVVQVLPDRAASSNDPAVILRELLATGRELLFVVAEQEARTARVGEQVIVTWYLYNGATVQQWQIGAIPKLKDFWIEELDVRAARAETVMIGDVSIQKMPVRRVALYPLRAGRLEVGPMEIEARVMRRTSRGPFAMFEGSLIEAGFTSAPVTIDAVPLPAGPAVAAVGDLSLRCSEPQRRNGGPVVLDATVTGRGNLRAAQPPAFASMPVGEVQRIERGVTVQKTEPVVMTRRWQYLIFPRDRGTMRLPALQMPVFSPAAGERQLLQCGATTLAVTGAARPRAAPGTPTAAQQPLASRSVPFVAAGAIGAVFVIVVMPWWRRRRALERQIRRVMKDQKPAEVRERVHEVLEERGLVPSALVGEGSDRGDAYRSLRSLLDALERDRIELENRQREVRRRIRELLLNTSI
ncbi:MAG TPA: BatD family protein [Thermoanaerobaculia bacterium]|nr:BatD family protein [Thermoanaerobaculia bacterium]